MTETGAGATFKHVHRPFKRRTGINTLADNIYYDIIAAQATNCDPLLKVLELLVGCD